jgi:glycosyltransferase involved in cell wall biosynthesis
LKILFITENFPPEVNAAATRVYERACYWAKDGHEVTVLTCFPNFPQGRIYQGYRQSLYDVSVVDGIRIIRLPTYIARNEGFFRRTLDFVTFMVVSTIAAAFLRRPDVVVATSPQFFSAVAGFMVGFLRRRPFVFEVSDLWPASIAAVGAMSRGKLYRALEGIELFLYRRAASVVVLTASFRDDLIRRGIAAGKIAVVVNGVDLSRYERRGKDAELMEKFALQDKFVLGYIGTHGMAHGLENAVAAADMLRHDARFRLLFVGDGACKPALERQAAEANLGNVIFESPQPKAMMPRIWSICDAALIHLKNDTAFSEVIPSKMFEAMAMGLPLLVAAPSGEASRIVEREGAGVRVSSADPRELADATRHWMDDTPLVRRFAECSLHAAPNYSRQQQAATFAQVLAAAVAGRGGEVSSISNARVASASR